MNFCSETLATPSLIYLDHAASTPLDPRVLDAMLPWLSPDNVGNPSSPHSQGLRARDAIENARRQVAELINAQPDQIVFTSGATEANNMWVRNLRDGVVLTTDLEHESVLSPMEHSDAVEYRTVATRNGIVDMHALEVALRFYDPKQISAVSMIWVNNEIGTINPIAQIGQLCHERDVLFHTDATQAIGHVFVDVEYAHADYLTMSAHKFGGPMGVGAYYARHPIDHYPILFGGSQESHSRGGTENVAGIVGMGAAAELVLDEFQRDAANYATLRFVFTSTLKAVLPEARINFDSSLTVGSILSVTLPGAQSEAVLIKLDAAGIAASAGAACSSGSLDQSRVLLAAGLSEEDAACTIRISFGRTTTEWDVAIAASEIAKAVHSIQSMSAHKERSL